MTAWQMLEPPIPSELSSIGSGISTVLNLVKTQTQALTALARLSAARANLLNLGSNTTFTAINLALTTLNELLGTFLDSTGVYMLTIPLSKKGIMELYANDDPNDVGSNYLTTPINDILQEIPTERRNALTNIAAFAQLIRPLSLFPMGNAYILKTITSALFDEDDPNVPQFTDTTAWGYCLFIAGASDPILALQRSKALDFLFNTRDSAASTPVAAGADSIIAENVRVELSPRQLNATVRWDLVPQTVVPSSHPQITLTPIKFAVIRSTDWRALEKYTVTELFGTSNLTQGLTGNLGAKVVALINYDGVQTKYEDTETLTNDQEYVYHIAFQTRARDSNAVGTLPQNETTLSFDTLSTGVKIKPSQGQILPTASAGTPPDWKKTPSVVRVIPSLNSFVNFIQSQLNHLTTYAESTTEQQNQYLTFLDKQVKKLTEKTNSINSYITTFENVVASLNTGVHVKIDSGTGNTGAFIAALSEAIGDTTDENRPDFDQGDEHTCGILFLAIGANPAEIQPVIDLFNLLFGASETNPALSGINDITTAVTQIETDALADLQAENTSGTSQFDENLVPTTGANYRCTPVTPTEPTFDGTLNGST